jgi:hypothetical protein
MAVIEKEAPAIQTGSRRSRAGWALGGLAVLALVSVAVAAVVVVRTPEQTTAPVRPVVGSRPGSLYTEQELTIMRLVAKGYLPAETLEGEPFRTKVLISQGLIPRGALAPRGAPITPLYTEAERAVMAAVAAGMVPEETLEGEPFRTKRLINQGLIPRQAAGS